MKPKGLWYSVDAFRILGPVHAEPVLPLASGVVTATEICSKRGSVNLTLDVFEPDAEMCATMFDDIRPFEYYPRGIRWPWYPCYEGMMRAGGEITHNEQGHLVPCEIIGSVLRERIGLRRWALHHRRRIEEKIR
jgi:hypothetical protein